VCHAFSGVATSDPTGVSGSSGSTAGTAPNTSTSAPAPSQTDTLAVAVAGWNQTIGGEITPDAGWTTPASASQETTGSSFDKSILIQYLVQSTATAYDFDTTIPVATGWAAVIAAFRKAA
jgi:hypothetical protein